MSHDLTPEKAEAEFWKHLKSSNTGMLGLDQPGQHAQPMTAFREEETGTIWFFTRDDTDLAKDVGTGTHDAMFTYASKDQDVWACIRGELSRQEDDREIVDRHWNPVLAAWYPDGKDDSHLTVLRFDAEDGRVWVSGGLIKFAFEIAKANLTKSLPDAGGVANVQLA